ncbi:MAG: nucleotidyltransferase family protein [Desulfurococcales archaeon]|nr:nucleotidyltransferase family protein [Desulfurococcales archaeon]
MRAAIIAGGFGKRLRPLTEEKPKTLVEVAGRPILEWQIMWLKRYGVDTVIILAGYLREKIIEFLGSGSRFGVSAVYVVEEEPLGTGGALKNAEAILRDGVFIATNGDIITNIPVNKLIDALLNSDALAAIALVPLKSPYGVVEVDSKGYVRSFIEKPVIEHYLVNAGVYAMKPEVFKYVPAKGDLERDTFPRLAKEGLLKGVVFRNVYWRSIDTIKDIEEASRELREGLPEVRE